MSGAMSGDARATEADRVGELEQELHMARRELKWVRVDQEHLTEALQRVRRQRARLREQSESLASALAAELSATYWRDRESGLGRLRRRPAESEDGLVREVEGNPLFDAGWYLRQNQDAIIEQRIPPALHHVRHANERRLDPGETFSTGRYLLHHPEAAATGLPALVHAQRNGLIDDGLLDEAPVGDGPLDLEATDR